jgi:hypothetical protein
MKMLWCSEIVLIGLTTVVITAALVDAVREHRKRRREKQL